MKPKWNCSPLEDTRTKQSISLYPKGKLPHSCCSSSAILSRSTHNISYIIKQTVQLFKNFHTHRCAFSFTYNFWLLNTYGCSLDSCWTLEQKSIPCKNPFSANHPNESPWMEYGDGFWFLFMIQFIMISWKKWNFHTSWINILNIWMTINRKLNH